MGGVVCSAIMSERLKSKKITRDSLLAEYYLWCREQ